MLDVDESIVEMRQIPGWACVAIGLGFIIGLPGLIVLLRVLSGS